MKMNDENNFYQNDYKRYVDMYRDICINSRNNQKGMRIADIRKKYGLKKTDIETLFKFVGECYDKISSDSENGQWYDFEIYKPVGSPKYKNYQEQIDFEWDENEDIEEKSVNDFDDECYIRITDNISLILKRLNESNIDITNASLLSKLGEDEKLRKLWNRISNVSISENNIIVKGIKEKSNQKQQYNKKIWIRGIIQPCWCEVKAFTWKKKKVILPLGLYYDYVIKRYKCVYYDKISNSRKEVQLDELEKVELTNDDILVNSLKKMKLHFNIEDYIKEIQKETMKLKVYNEANVINKLEELLKNNQCTKVDMEECVIFQFKTDDSDEYMKVFNSYGSSVIILEPKRLQEDVMEMINNTLTKYEMIEKQTT